MGKGEIERAAAPIGVPDPDIEPGAVGFSDVQAGQRVGLGGRVVCAIAGEGESGEEALKAGARDAASCRVPIAIVPPRFGFC